MTSPPWLPLLIVRPAPGATATAQRARALGLIAVEIPLVSLNPLPWSPPPAGHGHDALLLTSANAVRLAGQGVAALAALPAYCVGDATAEAARAAGLDVAHCGTADGAVAVRAMQLAGVQAPLWLAGRDHRPLAYGKRPPAMIMTYAADWLPPPQVWADAILAPAVIAVHSPRAARRVAGLADRQRYHLKIAAISPTVAAAAGTGWADCAAAGQPNDAALVELAQGMCQT